MTRIPKVSNYTPIYSLFILHSKGKLSPKNAQKIESVINECEECKVIYEDILDFFNDDDALLFEITNPKNVERVRSTSNKEMNKLYDLSSMEKISCEVDIDPSDLHCCGS